MSDARVGLIAGVLACCDLMYPLGQGSWEMNWKCVCYLQRDIFSKDSKSQLYPLFLQGAFLRTRTQTEAKNVDLRITFGCIGAALLVVHRATRSGGETERALVQQLRVLFPVLPITSEGGLASLCLGPGQPQGSVRPHWVSLGGLCVRGIMQSASLQPTRLPDCSHVVEATGTKGLF